MVCPGERWQIGGGDSIGDVKKKRARCILVVSHNVWEHEE